jgi:N12 class adenine-specific DNA methylase
MPSFAEDLEQATQTAPAAPPKPRSFTDDLAESLGHDPRAPGLIAPGTIDLTTEPHRQLEVLDVGGQYALVPHTDNSRDAYDRYQQHYGVFADPESAIRYADQLDQRASASSAPPGSFTADLDQARQAQLLTVGPKYAVAGQFSPLEQEVIGGAAPAQLAAPPQIVRPTLPAQPVNPQLLEPPDTLLTVPSVPTTAVSPKTGQRYATEAIRGTGLGPFAEPVEGILQIARGASQLPPVPAIDARGVPAPPGPRYTPESGDWLPPVDAQGNFLPAAPWKPGTPGYGTVLMNATSDIIEGTFKAGTPFIPQAVAAAPVRSILGIGATLVAQYGAEEATRRLGGTEDAARFVGNVAALASAGVTLERIKAATDAATLAATKTLRAGILAGSLRDPLTMRATEPLVGATRSGVVLSEAGPSAEAPTAGLHETLTDVIRTVLAPEPPELKVGEGPARSAPRVTPAAEAPTPTPEAPPASPTVIDRLKTWLVRQWEMSKPTEHPIKSEAETKAWLDEQMRSYHEEVQRIRDSFDTGYRQIIRDLAEKLPPDSDEARQLRLINPELFVPTEAEARAAETAARREIAQAAPQPTPPAPAAAEAQPVGVPFVITRQMEAGLRARGFSQADIDRMTPAEAHQRLAQPVPPTAAPPAAAEPTAPPVAPVAPLPPVGAAIPPAKTAPTEAAPPEPARPAEVTTLKGWTTEKPADAIKGSPISILPRTTRPHEPGMIASVPTARGWVPVYEAPDGRRYYGEEAFPHSEQSAAAAATLADQQQWPLRSNLGQPLTPGTEDYAAKLAEFQQRGKPTAELTDEELATRLRTQVGPIRREAYEEQQRRTARPSGSAPSVEAPKAEAPPPAAEPAQPAPTFTEDLAAATQAEAPAPETALQRAPTESGLHLNRAVDEGGSIQLGFHRIDTPAQADAARHVIAGLFPGQHISVETLQRSPLFGDTRYFFKVSFWTPDGRLDYEASKRAVAELGGHRYESHRPAPAGPPTGPPALAAGQKTLPPAAATQAEAPQSPKAMLRAALPGLGFTLSTDADEVWRRLQRDTQRRLKRIPTIQEMRDATQAWIDRTRAKQQEGVERPAPAAPAPVPPAEQPTTMEAAEAELLRRRLKTLQHQRNAQADRYAKLLADKATETTRQPALDLLHAYERDIAEITARLRAANALPEGEAEPEKPAPPAAAAQTGSYVVEVKAVGEGWGARNNLRFATRDEADRYGRDLLSRWMGAEDYRVVESPDPVNRRWNAETGTAEPLAEKPAPPAPAAKTAADFFGEMEALDALIDTGQLDGNSKEAADREAAIWARAKAAGVDDALAQMVREALEKKPATPAPAGATVEAEAEHERPTPEARPPHRAGAGQLPERGGRGPVPGGAAGGEVLGAVPPEGRGGAEGAGAARVPDRHPEGRPPDHVRGGTGAAAEPAVEPAAGAVDVPDAVALPPRGVDGHDLGVAAPDYVLTPERIRGIIERGAVRRAADNLAAIRLLKTLDTEQRYATPAEQEQLAKYVGFGASEMAAFVGTYEQPRWSTNERTIWRGLQALLSDAERERLAGSTLNAHFSFDLYRPIWAALEHAGFTGGRVLEPAVGAGHAFGFMPPAVHAASTLNGVELDPITAGIAHHLYPSARIQAVGYEKARIARGTQDLILSNVPFGDYGVDDPRMPAIVTKRIHNYFFGRALDRDARPGGLVVFITSRYTLDSVRWAGVRQYLIDRADFVGAVRLPNTAFEKSAKTEVVTDIVVLRRRGPDEAPDETKNAAFLTSIERPTLSTGSDEEHGKVYRSTWYDAHPDLILGTETRGGSMYGSDEYTVVAPQGAPPLSEAVEQALRQILPEGSYLAVPTAKRDAPAPTVVEGAYKPGELRRHPTQKGRIIRVSPDGETEDITPTKVNKATGQMVPDVNQVRRLTGLIAVRDALRATVATMQSPDATDAKVRAAQHTLTQAYRTFHREFGDLNRLSNRTAFRDDPDAENLLALERLEKRGEEKQTKSGRVVRVTFHVVGLADIFTKRTLHAPATVEHVETPKEALLASLGFMGRLDWPYMARISGQAPAALQQALIHEGLVFEQPDGSVVLAEEYLSGDVVSKLEDAEAADDPKRFARNLEALKAVRPADKTRDDLATDLVSVNLGAHWIPHDDLAAFVNQQLGTRRGVGFRVDGTETLVRWLVQSTTAAQQAAARHPLAVGYNPTGDGTTQDTYTFLELLDDTLNMKPATLGHYEGSGTDRRFVKEEDATLAARANQENLRDLWKQHVFASPDLQDRLLALFNTRFNRTVERQYDGSHMVYPGMATLTNAAGEKLSFFPHQNRAVWRALASGNTLLAHDVGAGKTFELIAIAMEMRRTGRARKPMITVPTNILTQWREDILRLYPGARVLAFTEDDLIGTKRRRAMARIAFGDWDIVLVPHSSFGLLAVSDERMVAEFQAQVAALKAVEDAAGGGPANNNVKAMQRQRRKIEDKIRKKLDRIKARGTDKNVTWEQLGVDALLIDESHSFKNLAFYTKLENLRGLSRSEADKSLDVYIKIKDINEQSNYRNVVFGTATPVMNSMAEIFAVQRYLQPQTLQAHGFDNFDNWYSMFARAVQVTEPQPDGTYKEVTRLKEFSNLKLLSGMVREVMDYVGEEDMPYLKVPATRGGKIEIVTTEPHPLYPRIREWFSERLHAIKMTPPHYDFHNQVYVAPERKDPLTGAGLKKFDNILTVMTDAKKAAVDARLVLGNRATDWPGSRIQQAADRIAAFYRRETSHKGVALIFLDVGTPKHPEPLEFLRGVTVEDETAEPAEAEDETDTVGDLPTVETDDINLYAELRQALVKRGIPSREIAAIHQTRNAAERLLLFEAANAGKVRVVFASTDKGGVGMNIQLRGGGLYEIDLPRYARPGDLRQRRGRFIRQGNMYRDLGGVEHVRFVTRGTADEYLWGLVSIKDYQLRQFYKGELATQRDLDPSTMSIEEAMVAASNDPRVIEMTELKSRMARLEAQALAGQRAIANATHDRQEARRRKADLEQDLRAVTAWVTDHWRTQRGEAFSMRVGTTTYTKPSDANPAVIARLKAIAASGSLAGHVATIGGIAVRGLTHESGTVRVSLDGAPWGGGTVFVTNVLLANKENPDTLGEGQHVVASIVNEFEDIANRPKRVRANIDAAETEIAQAEKLLAHPPEAITTLRTARQRVTALETELTNETLGKELAREATTLAAQRKPGEAFTDQPTAETLAREILVHQAWRRTGQIDAAQQREMDQSIRALAEQRGVADRVKALLGRLLTEETGALTVPPFTVPAAVATRVRRDAGLIRTLFAPQTVSLEAEHAAGAFTAHIALRDQRVGQARRTMRDIKRIMDGWSHTQSLAFWDVMQGLQPLTTLPADLHPIVRLFGDLLDHWTEQVTSRGLIRAYLEHYWPQEWIVGKNQATLLQRLFGRRPLAGPESYRRRRTIPTTREGIEEYGLEPVSWNPAVQLERKITEMARSVMAYDLRKDWTEAGLRKFVGSGKRAPEGWQMDTDRGPVFGPREIPVETSEGETVTGRPTFGRLVAGHYYLHPDAQRLLQRFISPGLTGKSLVFDAFNQLGNLSSQTLLGWSTFHLWMTGIEAVFSKATLVAELAARGEMLAAGRELRWVGPHGVLRDLVRGHRLVKRFYADTPDAADVATIASQIIQGGGGFGWNLFEHTNAPGKFMEDARGLLGALERGAFPEAATHLARGVARAPIALASAPTTAIMNTWVPYLKAAAFEDLARMEMRRLPPDATLADHRKVLQAAWKVIDDRFGQLRYDNLFWDNTAKQLAMSLFLSVGWQVGSLRPAARAIPGQVGVIARNVRALAGGGAGGGHPPIPMRPAGVGPEGEPRFVPRLEPWLHRDFAWVLMGTLLTVLAGAIAEYLWTGEVPKSLEDLYAPRTGEIDPRTGRRKRRLLISYMKDYLAWARHPATTMTQKLRPNVQLLVDTYRNADFRGDMLRNPDDPVVKQVGQVMDAWFKKANPIAWGQAEGDTFWERLQSYAKQQVSPFRPAGAELERSRLEQYLFTLQPPQLRTPEEVAKLEARQAIRRGMKEGTAPEAIAAARGELSRRSLELAMKSGLRAPLVRAYLPTTLEQALKGYELATPEERVTIKPFLLNKFRSLFPNTPPTEMPTVRDEFLQALKLPVAKPAAAVTVH